jgi:hypothetical protein
MFISIHYVRLHYAHLLILFCFNNKMSKNVKQLAKGLARRASIFGRKEDLVFQSTISSSRRRRALLEHVPELQGQAIGVQRNEVTNIFVL